MQKQCENVPQPPQARGASLRCRRGFPHTKSGSMHATPYCCYRGVHWPALTASPSHMTWLLSASGTSLRKASLQRPRSATSQFGWSSASFTSRSHMTVLYLYIYMYVWEESRSSHCDRHCLLFTAATQLSSRCWVNTEIFKSPPGIEPGTARTEVERAIYPPMQLLIILYLFSFVQALNSIFLKIFFRKLSKFKVQKIWAKDLSTKHSCTSRN